jgi:hypothetical protein
MTPADKERLFAKFNGNPLGDASFPQKLESDAGQTGMERQIEE